MLRVLFLLLPFILNAVPYHHESRAPIAPYLSGDTFRFLSDHAYDEVNRILPPQTVRQGQTVFVNADRLADFFSKVHPGIQNRYILVTHNSDQPIPGLFSEFLNDEKLIAWFGQNVEEAHPKLHAIPIGLENRYWKPDNVEIISRVKSKQFEKKHLLYCNFSLTSYLPERPRAFEALGNAPFSNTQTRKGYEPFIEEIAASKFVLCPRGNGLDTHRVWEALYTGSYAIVKTSGLDPLYADLPIVIVNDWHEVTEEFLNGKYAEFQSRAFKMEKLYTDFWLAWIDSYRKGL